MGNINLHYSAQNDSWVRAQARRVSRRTRASDTDEIQSSCIRRLSSAKDAQSTEQFKAVTAKIARRASASQYHAKVNRVRREESHAIVCAYLRHEHQSASHSLIESATDSLMRLDPDLREVLILTLRGHKSDTIAELQGVPAYTIRRRRQEAIKLLREACAEDD